MIALFVVSCSNDPSSSAKNLLENKISTESNGKIKLVSFTKNNGISREESGAKTYQIEYSAIIEYQEDCWQENYAQNPFYVPNMRLGVDALETCHHKGEKRTINSSMYLEKADNGWRIAR